MTRVLDWLYAAAFIAALCLIYAWLDGQPSDIDSARDTAAAVSDAQSAARHQARVARAEAAMRQDARQRQAAAQTAVLIAVAGARP